jgi:hypothetical protein
MAGFLVVSFSFHRKIIYLFVRSALSTKRRCGWRYRDTCCVVLLNMPERCQDAEPCNVGDDDHNHDNQDDDLIHAMGTETSERGFVFRIKGRSTDFADVRCTGVVVLFRRFMMRHTHETGTPRGKSMPKLPFLHGETSLPEVFAAQIPGRGGKK